MSSRPSLLDIELRHLADFDLTTRKGRHEATILNPLAFALVYMRHHLKDTDGNVSIAPVHMDWVNDAKRWATQSDATRSAYIAPRATGKSTWFFLILPMWAAAHGHKRFAAAFADSGGQAETHLTTFKNELDTNRILRSDFPNLCSPARREHSGQTVADNRAMIVMKSGFTFAARGIDAANLGLKMNENRPDLLIFDDVEPDESSYSQYQAKKRLQTIQDAILPMNLQATVVLVGTVTMAGGITHQLVQSDQSNLPPEPWIKDEKVEVRYYAPTTTNPDGSTQSIWPEKWSLEYLNSISHTRSYAKNFRNQPVTMDGDYWTEEDITYAPNMDGLTRTIIAVDPAITTKKTSDYTGIANIAFRPPHNPGANSVLQLLGRTQPRCLVQDAVQVKLVGPALRNKVLQMISTSPTPVIKIIVEVNQGGDLWLGVFHDMPCKVEIVTSKIKKEVRAARLLNHYQKGYVQHRQRIPILEDQMLSYPDVMHDDLIDAVGLGVSYFARKRNRNVGTRNVSYV